jgi:hypothetical protein
LLTGATRFTLAGTFNIGGLAFSNAQRYTCPHPATSFRWELSFGVPANTGDSMDIILEMRPESGFLEVGAKGEFSLQGAKRTFLEMLEAVARYKIKKVLFDGRRLMGAPEAIERFDYGEFAAASVWKFKLSDQKTLHHQGSKRWPRTFEGN